MKVRTDQRGCVFFNFGSGYSLRLLVALQSLRRVYEGPITVFLEAGQARGSLRKPLARLHCDIIDTDRISKSSRKTAVRHKLFLQSPYKTTLVFDSDLLFRAPIDELWEPLEREGVLFTRFYAPPYGVDGTAEIPGWANRVELLEGVRQLVDEQTWREACRRMVEDRIDINVGVMGISRPKGEAFLTDWSERMERVAPGRILLLDEMLSVALAGKHRHALVDEKWNCPADEFFRQTNLADAKVIHYFADGLYVNGLRLGRNESTWAGMKWYEAYCKMSAEFNVQSLVLADPTFTGTRSRRLAYIARQTLGSLRKQLGRARTRLKGFARRAAFSAQQTALAGLLTANYRLGISEPVTATVVILSYKRSQNIPLIVRSVLLCGFIHRVIVSNNNPDLDLQPFLTIADPRLVLLQQDEHRGPSYRYEVALDYPGDWYICIDDDSFPTPWQLRRLLSGLIIDPSVPRGAWGQRYHSEINKFKVASLPRVKLGEMTQLVDVIGQVHVFTRAHLETYFAILNKMQLENSAVEHSEDVIISLSGSGRPVLQNVGYISRCATSSDKDVATHGRPGFSNYRRDLYLSAKAIASSKI